MSTLDEVRKIQKVFSHFSTIDPKMQLSTVMVFLEIIKADAEDKPITNRDIETRLGMRSGTVTRNIYYWTEEGHPANTGHVGFVSVHVSVQDRRQREFRLTSKGRLFIKVLLEN